MNLYLWGVWNIPSVWVESWKFLKIHDFHAILKVYFYYWFSILKLYSKYIEKIEWWKLCSIKNLYDMDVEIMNFWCENIIEIMIFSMGKIVHHSREYWQRSVILIEFLNF